MSLYETAKFEVKMKLTKNIELREYPQLFLATTSTEIDKKFSGGFNNVFQYISGYNEDNKKISMTTPVVSLVEEGILKTQFLVPEKYGANPPKPKGNLVSIETMNEGLYMVVKFSGKWSEAHFEKMDKKLLNMIGDEKYTIVSNKMILRYNPPFIPGFLRRNEIMYRVKKQ